MEADDARLGSYLEAVKNGQKPHMGMMADAMITRQTSLKLKRTHPDDRKMTGYADRIEQQYDSIRALFPRAPRAPE